MLCSKAKWRGRVADPLWIPLTNTKLRLRNMGNQPLSNPPCHPGWPCAVTLPPPLQPKSLRLLPSPHRLPPTVLAFGSTCHGSDLLPPACSCFPPAPNQAGYSPPTSPGIADVGSGCVSPKFPPHATLLRHPQSPVAEEDCAGQVVGRCQLGQGWHMLDSVVFDCGGKINLVRIWWYNLGDAIRAYPVVV